MLQPLKINKKIDNDAKLAQIIKENIPTTEFILADEVNAIVGKINEMVPVINVSNGGFQGTLSINEKRVDSGFYIPTESGIFINADNVVVDLGQGVNFVTYDGNKWEVAVVPITTSGKIEKGDTGFVSGGEVYNNIQNFKENEEFDYAVIDQNQKLLFGVRKDGSLFPDKETNLELIYSSINDKVDKEEDKTLIDKSVAQSFNIFEHPEFAYLVVDKENKIVQSVTHNGIYFPQNTSENTPSIQQIGKVSNNLKNQESIFDIEKITDYGKPTAEYHIKTDFKGRISVKGKFIRDINSTEKLQSFISTPTNSILEVVHSKPIQAIEKLYLADTYDIMLPQAALQSGFKSGETIRRYENYNNRASKFTMMDGIKGDQMIMIWFRGKPIIEKISNITEVSNTNSMLNYYTEIEQRNRSNSLQEFYQDLYISIENNELTIGRDSEGIIFSTSLQDSNGKWKNLKDFYEELVPPTPLDAHPKNPISSLVDFYIDHINLNTLEDTSTVLQCGKIYLISYLKQCINPDNLGEGNTTEMAYDCYPFFIHSNVDKSEHIFDLILNDKSIDVFVNGLEYSSFPKEGLITLGNSQSDLQLYDLEINYGDYGDAEVYTHYNHFTSIASSRTPICFGIMAHNIYDTYEGSTHTLGNLGISTTKLYRVLEDAKSKGYSFINFRQWVDWQSGNGSIPKKSIILVTDDDQIHKWWQDNQKIRASFERKGAKINFAQIIEALLEPNSTTSPQIVLDVQLSGHGVANHTRWHNCPPFNKTAPTFMIELAENRFVMSKYGICQEVMVYNKSGGDYSGLHGMLEYYGYVGAIGVARHTDQYGKLHQNRFSFTRMNIGTSSEIILM
ncbi:hypothetical protein M2306_002050 [Myroides gitamensis]|uniref:hypothetical protein n=1 Tax=Myroides odoratus TaxID=256 RepID=UPI0021671EB0|nr:hypothetical protein [Myroides odoratus]MCS4239509.1 hypothetical protein [Myroides odoratus]MDH6601356.1 hypothetical protein [Myroides gitamensis]